MTGRRAFSVERFFQALGDNTRLRLLNLLGEKEICVCYLVEILDQPQPKVSRHLAYLRSAGVVEARREGKWMHYRIVKPPHVGAARILHQTLDWLKQDRAMQADRGRLGKACCTAAGFIALRGAPAPTRSGTRKHATATGPSVESGRPQTRRIRKHVSSPRPR